MNFGIKASTVRQFLISSGLPSKKAVQIVNQTLNELKVEMHPDKTFIGQELVAMGEYWGGDMC